MSRAVYCLYVRSVEPRRELGKGEPRPVHSYTFRLSLALPVNAVMGKILF